MKRTSRTWPELRGGVGRFTTMIWIVALLLWFALSTSGYSRWHSYFVENNWLFLGSDRNSHFEGIYWGNESEEGALWTPFPVNKDKLLVSLQWDNSHEDNDLPADESLNQLEQKSESDDILQTERTEGKDVDDGNGDKPEHTSEMEDQGSPIELTVSEVKVADTSKICTSVEEMGLAAVGDTEAASLQLRRIIENYFANHGANYVKNLPAKEFCSRGFVYGRVTEDGLGNDIYKILTAAGLSVMLNRSLIIGEHGSTNPAYFGLTGRVRLPFGDYLKYSNETFSVSEIKRLWVKHDCAGTFKRPLIMRIDDFQRPTRTKVLCEDWTMWHHPIIWFKGTTDSIALQFFLKNRHPVMRSRASLVFGDPSMPSSRPNTFGELFRSFISPMPVVEEAVQWVLRGGPDPDISVHMRMLNSRSRRTSSAACSCIKTVVKNNSHNKTFPQVVVISDTPFIIRRLKNDLEGFAHVIHFDYHLFMRSYQNLSKVMSEKYFQPPEKRTRDWGPMPRWVAIVDFFLASRAKSAVISGANRRVATTYAQLLGSFTAAKRMDEQGENFSNFGFYSSFQWSILTEGLSGQKGWGHSWRRFGGRLSCNNQADQCARTPLLPYAWWDGPWQSPTSRDLQRMLAYGINVSETGVAKMDSLKKTCETRKTPLETLNLHLPPCKRLTLCQQRN